MNNDKVKEVELKSYFKQKAANKKITKLVELSGKVVHLVKCISMN